MNKSIVFSNTIYQLLARFGTVGFMFLLSILLTRQANGELWGKYSVVLNYIALFYMLADFGINILTVKDYSENENLIKSGFMKLFGFKLILGVILTIIAICTTFYLPYDIEVRSSIVFGSVLILIFSIQNAFLAVFQTKLEYWKSAVVNILIGALVFFGIYAYTSFSLNILLTNVVALTVAGYLFGLVISAILTKTHVSYSLKGMIDWMYSKSLLQRTAFLGVTIVLNSFMFSGDKFILSLFRSDFEVGTYSLAYKLFELYLVIPTFVMNSYYPMLIKLRKQDYLLFIEKIKSIALKLSGLWVLTSLGVWLLGSLFIPDIWGLQMIGAVTPFTILIFTSIPFFITAPLTWIFYMENKHRQLLVIYLAGFIFNLAANLMFIPQYGSTAAAYITAITEVIVLLMLVFALQKKS